MRNKQIDLLRFIGLSMIIFAHVNPPSILFQIRNFDVPLMVLVSGMSFGLAFKGGPYFQYLWKRIKRLVFPVWLFLSIFFITLYLFKPSAIEISLHNILTSYFFIDGIGYVWIIRVFLLVALVSPTIYSLNKKSHSEYTFLAKIAFIYIIYEIARYLLLPYLKVGIGEYFSLIFFYMIPYAVLFGLGLTIPKLKFKSNLYLFILFSLCFICLAIYFWINSGNFIPTQNFKYPPSLYYFSYAIAASIFLWIVGEKIWGVMEKYKLICSAILFIASNSIWIYLWHIPLVKFIHLNFALKYILVFSIATFITYIQVQFVINILIPASNRNNSKKNLKMILTG